MIGDTILRNLSPARQRSDLQAMAKLSRYFGLSPDRLVLEDVCVPGLSGVAGRFLAGAEPDGLCVAFLLRRDAGPGGNPGAHRLCAEGCHR